MKTGLYLQEVIDPSCFVSHAFNLIVAPCGSGKTTAAINKIAAMASSPRKALFLIDTQNGNLRLAENETLTLPYTFFPQLAGGTPFPNGREYPRQNRYYHLRAVRRMGKRQSRFRRSL